MADQRGVGGLHHDLPAERAGVQVNDVIVALDGRRPVTGVSLREVLAGKKLGDSLTLDLIRGGKPMQLTAQFEEPIYGPGRSAR